jgi:very-short-patch-repair endonuclease
MLERLWALAERQYGLIRRADAALLVGDQRLVQLVRSGRLVPVGYGVYRVPGAPRTPEQALLGAVWAGGPLAVAGGRSSGWQWALVDEPPARPEVLVPAGSYRRLQGVHVRQSVDLTDDVATVRRGIPTLSPLLTMIELARVLDGDALAESLERGLDLFTMRAMWATLDRYGRRGRDGIALLRDVVSNRALGEKPSDADVEERCAQLLVAAGFEGWVFHHRVHDAAGRFVAEPDFAFPAIRLAVEVDGADKFRQRGYLQEFFERRHRLRAIGWDLEHFAWAHIVRRPTYVTSVLSDLIAARTAAVA